MKDGSLYLKCTLCSHETLISSASTSDELIELFGDDKVKRAKEQYCFEYMRALHTITGSFDINFRKDIALHIKALSVYIDKHLQNFINYRSEDSVKETINNLYYSRFHDSEIIPNWNWEKDGRLFDIELGRKLLSQR